jgi:cohesin complex subunit SA-1/2
VVDTRTTRRLSSGHYAGAPLISPIEAQTYASDTDIMDSDSELPNGTAESTRRKSGRVHRRPDMFAEEEHAGSILTNGSAKRKRISIITAEDVEDDEETSEDEEDDSEPDEEEVREKRRNQRKRPKTSKPAPKRSQAKPSTTLAIRSANVPSRPASKSAKIQKARARQSQVNKEGLYAEVFGRGQTAEEAANTWLSSVRKDNVVAIRDLVNFIFESIGCDVKIASSDVEDIDNVPSKLSDVLEEQYSHGQSAEYPLVSKSRQFAEFKTVLVDFFKAVIQALHDSSILYDQLAVYDNIHVWVATMTGAKYRPFRHTATVISLAMCSALCTLPADIQKRAADYKRQLAAEKKKRSSNKARLASVQEELKAEEKKLEIIDALLRDAFDTVYVHRYRDVDEKVRVECVAALGGWIDKYSTMFLEGQYLRYLGWVMSDPNSATRLEVIRQVKKLFSDKNVAALRAFTERFRSRMVEMGARDADVSVRVESVDLLDRLRLHELLEPDDIDTVGRLIFDAEPRVRKAVGKFFVASIDDLYNTLTEDWDNDQYNDALPPMDEADDLMAASQSWVKFKCLAQTLTSYDARSESAESPETNVRTLASTDDAESRYMLATQSLYPHFKDLEHWESLAAYLLYDHSSISADSEDDDIAQAVQGTYKLNDGEETVLLDVLYYSVKMYLTSVLDLARDKKGRTNATQDNIKQKQETAAHNLSTIVPQLLSRYGSTPQAAASILRLEQLLDADLISDLQGGEATYSGLLDDIDKQFSSHSDRKVLAEASRALRVARTFEQSKDAATTKVQEMWTEVIANLQRLLKGRTLNTRGSLEYNIMKELVNICVRTANLAGVSDCSSILEQSFPQSKKGKTKAGSWESGTVLELFLKLVARGIPDDDTTDGINELEDQISVAVITTLSFYFRWKVVALKQAVEANDARSLSTPRIVGLGVKRSSFVEALTPVITNRLPLDPVRFNAVLTTLDVFTLFATTKHLQPKPGKGELDEDVAVNVASLTAKIPETLLAEFLITFERAEKTFARRTRRKLTDSKKKSGSDRRARTTDIEEPTQEEIEKPPEDSDDEDNASDNASDSEDDGAEDLAGSRDAKKQAALVAEQSLCEVSSKLVLALIAGVLEDPKFVRERLMLNRGKLGKSYAGVVAYLDEKKEKKAKVDGKQTGGAGAAKGKAKSKDIITEEMELEEDRIVDGDDEDGEGDGRRDEVEREIVEEELAEAELAENENESADENEGLLKVDDEDDDEVMGD